MLLHVTCFMFNGIHMRFIKDLLLFDLETSGPDPDKDVVLQIGATILDKDNLLEKSYFSAYIRNSVLIETLTEQAKSGHTSIEALQNGLKPLDFIKQFGQFATGGVTLVVPNSSRLLFLKQMYKKQTTAFPFELYTLDLWTLSYVRSMSKGLKKIPTLHTLAEDFHLTLNNSYNAFERVKVQASIFKRICEEM